MNDTAFFSFFQGGRTALMLAAAKGDFHLVDEILKMISEKNVNAVDYVRYR